MARRTAQQNQLIDELRHYYSVRAYSDIQLANLLGVHRATINRNRQMMEKELGLPFIEEGRGRYRLDPQFRVSNVQLNPQESLALYLGGRRLQQQTKTGQRHVASALEKLADVLKKPMMKNLTRAAQVVLEQEQDPLRVAVMEKLVEGWMIGRKVRIRHHTLRGQPREYLVSPYQLEPAVWGDGVYLIGESDFHGGVATFKVERIEHATVTMEPYTIPEDFDSHTLLQHAWGIWHADKEPQPVRLQFSRYVTPRVKESIWHPSQTILVLPDGSCVWEAKIAEIQEMKPWVRAWGSDVEVLEPEELREEMVKTAVRLGKLYRTMDKTAKPLYLLPYAKTNPDQEGEIHLLLYHLIDVGQVTLVLWQEVLTDSIRQRLAEMLGLSVAEAGQWIAFLSALHDLGKAGPAYQKKYAPQWLKEALKEAGLGLDGHGKAYDPTTPHGTVSTWTLIELLPQMIDLDARFARQIATAVGGHHGTWPPPGAEERIDDSKFPLWADVRHELVREVQTVFQPPTTVTPPADHTERNTLLTIFSGLVSVADWLGSRNTECFGFVEHAIPTGQYAARSAHKAQQSLADLGWMGWQPDGRTLSFIEAFAYLKAIKEPRGVQAEVIAAAKEITLPSLVILEAPTGIGKTEAAVYLADCWLQQQHGRGLYVAMPTQATSNQMYGRIGQFLHHRYPDKNLNYHLVHGQATWQDTLKEKVELQSVGEDQQTHVAAESWFTPRKRTLLAPFGVGTVDQTLMSILQTRHFFVRLFGLSHKVVIFDEVHAYDAFMNTLFYRLLQWLSAIGTSVIILSATLPAAARRQLVEAYSGQSLGEQTVSYPSLTIATADQTPQIIPLSKPENITLEISFKIGREPEQILAYLEQQLRVGGCAAVICNTVRRAQDIYRVLEQARQEGTLEIDPDNLILFHARFPPIWRQEIEEKVLDKFGKEKPEKRPVKAIVVATQVIEQSLDSDFDLMISDLAPIDLIIQRAGRLHRHERAERYGHGRRLIITPPLKNDKGVPQFKRRKDVYQPYILLRTYIALESVEGAIRLPNDTTDLIESVYRNQYTEHTDPSWQAELTKTYDKMESEENEAWFKAEAQTILPASDEVLLGAANIELDDDELSTLRHFRVMTRDIPPGITLVCLHKRQGLFLEPGGDGELYDLQVEPTYLQAKSLQMRAITIHRGDILNYFLEQPVPPGWKKHATLKHYRLAEFVDNECLLEGMQHKLVLSRSLGLEVVDIGREAK